MKTGEISPFARVGMSPEEFGKSLGLSTPSVLRAVRRGEIRHFRIGRRIIIPATEPQRFERLAGAAPREACHGA